MLVAELIHPSELKIEGPDENGQGRCSEGTRSGYARMEMPPENRRPTRNHAIDAGYDYISAVKIFHKKDSARAPLPSIGLLPLPPNSLVPGFVCQAARQLLDLTQETLCEKAGASRKTVNDFEKGAIEPSAGMVKKLRQALEKEGARFVSGDSVIGVVVYSAIEHSSETRRKTPEN